MTSLTFMSKQFQNGRLAAISNSSNVDIYVTQKESEIAEPLT